MDLPHVNWNYPTAIKAGPGRIAELPALCAGLDMRKPLIVTDPGIAALPMLEHAAAACREAGLACGIFHDVKGNPTAYLCMTMLPEVGIIAVSTWSIMNIQSLPRSEKKKEEKQHSRTGREESQPNIPLVQLEHNY